MRKVVIAAILATLPAYVHAYELSDLIRDARAYHGGMLKEVGDLKIEQTGAFTAPGAGEAGFSSIMYRKGNRWRNDAKLSSPKGGKEGTIETIVLFDGQDTWTVSMGMKMKLAPGTSPSSSVPAYWNEPAAGSTIEGKEKVGDRECWVVASPKPPAGSPGGVGVSKVWIDTRSYVYVQSEATVSGKKVKTVFSDFRKLKNKYEIPYLSEVFSNGTKTMTAKVVKLETGVALADELFDPAGLAGTESTVDTEALMKQAEEMRKKIEAQYGGKKDKK
jgi:hypothetical protein